MRQKTSAKLAAKFRVTCASFFFGWVQYLWILFIFYFINNFYKFILFCILLILLGIIGQNNKIYIWKKIIKKTRIIITRCKYFAQINYYKDCSATAHLPPSSLTSLQSWGHIGNVFWITLECICSPDLFITFSVHPAKKGIFFFGKDYLDQDWASPLFVLFEVIVQLCWHTSLVQELILLSIRLLEQSTYIFLQRKKGVYLMKGFFFW